MADVLESMSKTENASAIFEPGICIFCPNKLSPSIDIALQYHGYASQLPCDYCISVSSELYQQINDPKCEGYFCAHCVTTDLKFDEFFTHLRLHYKNKSCICPVECYKINDIKEESREEVIIPINNIKEESREEVISPINNVDRNSLDQHSVEMKTHKGIMMTMIDTIIDKSYKNHEYKSKSNNHIKEYLKLDENVMPFHCEQCDFKSKTISGLQKHVKNHTDQDRPFNCEHCDYKCKTRTLLKKHIRIHTGERPFHCEHCDYKCNSNSNLKAHIRTHTGERPFQCDQCDFKGKTAYVLKTHIKIHTGETPFHCDYCPYKCKTATHLTSHMRVHTGERPFHCDDCDFKSRTSSGLRKHITTHMDERPFLCEHCEYTSKTKFGLTKHIRIHTREDNSIKRHNLIQREKKYRCEQCKYKTNRSFCLKRHILTHKSLLYSGLPEHLPVAANGLPERGRSEEPLTMKE